MTTLQWYALQSKPHRENTLWQHLKAETIEAYYPRLHVRTVNPRARKIQPYFPGYLFVHVDVQATGLGLFKWMPFATGLVCFGDAPSPVPDALIDGIRGTIDRLTHSGTQMYDELAPGQPVRVRSGPFEGYTGIFNTRLSGGERVRLLLELLSGQSVNVEIDAARLEPLKRRKGSARQG